MKNPFVKQDNTLLITGIAIGTAAAGAITYLLLSDKASGIRKQLADEFSSLIDKFLSKNDEQEAHEGYDFRHAASKAPKTDREALLKDEVLSHPQG